MENRHKKSFSVEENMIPRILTWASKNQYFSFFNGNNFTTLHGSFPDLVFVGKKSFIESSENSFDKLSELLKENNDWIYGYFSYDLKNEIEQLESNNPSSIPVDHLGFYIPETIIKISPDEIIIESFQDLNKVFNNICTIKVSDNPVINTPSITCLTPKWQYIDHVNKIKSAIVEGDFYEMNYCIEFTAQTENFNPLRCYHRLNAISPMPFSAFMRLEDKFLICASPERFIKKEGEKIISQPIKGTTRRSFDKTEDDSLKKILFNSEKEQAENLMIVDLVRNDLAKSSKAGSVKVDELFGISTFKKIHQMISTVSAIHNPTVATTDIIKHAFPMGSMTGAPKIRVMQEIEKLENSKRGLYSGAIGFFTPEQNFDFNVVIRSIIYDDESHTI